MAPPDTGNATQIVTGHPSEPSSSEYDDDIPAYVPLDSGNSSTPVYGAPPSEPESYYSEDDIPAYNPTPASGNDTNSSLPFYGGPPTEPESSSDDASLMMNLNNNDPQIAD